MTSDVDEFRVLVCGGRDFGDEPGDEEFLFKTLDGLPRRPTLIIEGEAPGADSLARAWAESRGIPVAKYPADWNKHGRAAGPIRNRQMLEDGKPHLVVAFRGGKGTADMCKQAKGHGVKVMRAVPPTGFDAMPRLFTAPRSLK